MEIRGLLPLALIILLSSLTVGLLATFNPSELALGGGAQRGELDLENGVVAVMLWSETCRTCEALKPYWERIEESPPEGVRVTDVPLIPGETDRIFVRYGARVTPTFLLLKDGKVVARIDGGFQAEDPEAFLRSWIEKSLAGIPSASSSGSEGPEQGLLTLLVLPLVGAAIAFSPCSAPVVAAYATMGRVRRGSEYAACAGASFLGVLALGALIAAGAALVLGVLEGLRVALASAAILFGVMTVLAASETCPSPSRSLLNLSRAGLPVACFSFGLIAMECSLPLLVGYLAIAGTSGGPISSLLGVGLLALGVGVALAAMLYLTSKASSKLSGPSGSSRQVWIERISGAVLVGLGAYILLFA